MKIFKKSTKRSMVEESHLMPWSHGKNDLEELILNTAEFLEETKRQLNKVLIRSSINSLFAKVDIIFEINRLQSLVQGWIERSRYGLYISCRPLNDIRITIKNSLQGVRGHITRIYFLLNKLNDGDFDRQFLKRLQAKGLLDLDENEIYSYQENDQGSRWTLTVHEKQQILTLLRDRAISASDNSPKTFLQRIKCLNCIAKPRRATESGRKNTVVNKHAKLSPYVGMKKDRNESIPEAADVLEIDRLETLVDCWVDRFRNDTYIFHLPLDYRGMAMKCDLVNLRIQITKIYILLERIGRRDGNFDRRFMRRLQKKGLLEIEEDAELFDNEENGTNQTELLTFQELHLQVLHHKAIADATVRRKRRFLKRKSRLICIATRTHSQHGLCQEIDKDHPIETFDNVFMKNSECQSSP